jgi:hypothetical protein
VHPASGFFRDLDRCAACLVAGYRLDDDLFRAFERFMFIELDMQGTLDFRPIIRGDEGVS